MDAICSLKKSVMRTMACCIVTFRRSLESCVGLISYSKPNLQTNKVRWALAEGNLGSNYFCLCSDVEREDRQINYYKNKLEAAETKIRDVERCFNSTFADDDLAADAVKKLIDEKESQAVKIFQLTEKLRLMEERESRLNSEIQEAKDQAELLEFRVLELEELQDKNTKPPSKEDECQLKDMATETDLDLIDSGFSSLRHSRSSSVTTELDEVVSDFGVRFHHDYLLT